VDLIGSQRATSRIAEDDPRAESIVSIGQLRAPWIAEFRQILLARPQADSPMRFREVRLDRGRLTVRGLGRQRGQWLWGARPLLCG
jgi:hypothetical protein